MGEYRNPPDRKINGDELLLFGCFHVFCFVFGFTFASAERKRGMTPNDPKHNDRGAVRCSAWLGVGLNNRDDFIRNLLERFGAEHTHLGDEKTLVRGKKLGRARVADEAKAPVVKIAVCELHSASVRIRLARDLAQNPVATLRRGEHHRWSALGLRQIRKRERNENY